MEKAPAIKTIFKFPIETRPHVEGNLDGDGEKEIEVKFPAKDSFLSEEDNYEPDTRDYKVLPLEATACALVLEEAADELAIIGHMGNLPKVQENLEYKTLAERFNANLGDTNVFDLETIEPYEIALDKQKFVKFQTDRSFVEKILRETINDLTKEGSYKYLVNQLSQHDQKFYEENQLLDNELENRNKLNALQNLLEYERNKALQGIQSSSEVIGKLKDQFQDILRENKIKTNYIENWENSRMEQNSVILDRQEEFYMNIINEGKINIEREIRIDAEIENFIRETQRQYEEEIQTWMERYDKEIEIRDTEIQILKEKREEQFNRLQEVSTLYEQHKSEIEQYLEVKEQRKKEAELLEKRHRAATKIQAWWRGLMVRKGFGQFRKKKGKKGKDSGKKKGKK